MLGFLLAWNSVSHLATSSRQGRGIVIRTGTAAQVFEYEVRIDKTGSGTCWEVRWTNNRCKKKETWWCVSDEEAPISLCGAARGTAAAQTLAVSNGHGIARRVRSVVERALSDRGDGHRGRILLVEIAHVVLEQPWNQCSLTSLSKDKVELSLVVDGTVGRHVADRLAVSACSSARCALGSKNPTEVREGRGRGSGCCDGYKKKNS